MKKGKLFAVLGALALALIILAACTAGGEDTVAQSEPAVEKTIYVGPMMVDCEGEGPQECLLIREDPMDSWQLWYSSIEGFDYEEGYLYQIVVEEQTVENPPAGGSSIKWVFKEELSKTPVEIRTMIVGPEQVECVGVGPQMCYQVKENPEDDWQLFYDQIDGFDYQPGYTYELVVAEIPIENPPADASSIQYMLVEEVDRVADLNGTFWSLTQLNGQPLVEGSEITLAVAEDGITGNAGCNNYFGSFEVVDGELSFGPLGSTMMACADPDITAQESDYLAALESAKKAELVGDELVLYDVDGKVILTFAKVEPLTLEDTQWEVLNYNNGKEAVVTVLPDSKLTAIFDGEQVGGSAGCNNYFGGYTVDGENINIGPLGSTMKFCGFPEGVMDQEMAYLAALQSAATYQITADRLELFDESGATAVSFVAGEPVALEGTPWEIIGYNNGRGGVTSVIIGSQITMNFADGQISGNAGCNDYFGVYEADEENISISDLANTEKFCADPDGVMDQEQEFLTALTTAATYTIVDDALNMRTEDGATVLNARPLEE